MQKTGDLGTGYPFLSHLESPCAVSLYFHIPFCSRKCPYCHFFVLPDHPRFKEPFLRALHREWSLRKEQLAGKRIVSIYFGGGTPTKLEPSALAALLSAIGQGAHIDPSCEITLEVNPEDAAYDKMLAYKSAGINRLSLGVQSLVEEELLTLNRQHTAQEAVHAIHQSHAAGFKNISIDLMFELPCQTLDSWKKTLAQLDDLPITHLSLYNLTIEPHTVFFKKRAQLEPRLPCDEEKLSMLQYAVAHLEAIGLKRYEISAFAKQGMHSRHNTGYWLGRPFFGLGPSAFSYWDKKRFSNHAHFQRYVDALNSQLFPVDFEECLPYPRNVQELLAVQLRLLEGVHMASFQVRHGKLPQEMHHTLEKLVLRNWLKSNDGCWQLTEEGMLFYDSVAAEIVSI
jgi:oxygen-independent coproporphyrinogen III oxidase